MPIYEYQCKECGERTEVIQRFADEPLTICPKCDGVVERLPSAPAVQFKGSGWYVTDYGSKKGSDAESKKESKKETSEKSESKTKSESSSSSSGSKDSSSKGSVSSSPSD